MEERLITLEHPLATAAIVAGPSGPRLRAGDDHADLEREPSAVWIADELWAVGGLLPPGAVAAELVDGRDGFNAVVTGGGAWLVLAPGPSPLVRYRDADGALVPVPFPDGVEVEPVPDADEPCPTCGAASWQRVVTAPPQRYGRDGAGRSTAAICGTCGHTEHLWVLYAPVGGDEEPPDQEEIAAKRAAAMAEAARFAPSTPLPRYRVTGAAVGDVAVEDRGPMPLAQLARWALEPLLMDRTADWPQRSPTAALLWMNGRTREASTAAARAPVTTVPLPVDGDPVPFTVVRAGDAFAAAARIDRMAVVVAGHGDPAALRLETER